MRGMMVAVAIICVALGAAACVHRARTLGYHLQAEKAYLHHTKWFEKSADYFTDELNMESNNNNRKKYMDLINDFRIRAKSARRLADAHRELSSQYSKIDHYLARRIPPYRSE
jgi:hypothetical protein